MNIVLHVSTGPNTHELLRFTDEDLPIVIGRSEDCNAVLPHQGVSRRHCRLARLPGRQGASALKVRDLGSTAGTMVNGAAVDRLEGATLKGGDVLRIGPVVVRVELVGECKRERRLRCNGIEETGAVAAVVIKARCEMCAGSVTDADLVEGGRMLAEERAICAACVGQLGAAPSHGPLIFLQPLGQGATATVYKALHWGQQRIVAVKRVSLAGRASSAEDVARLLREIAVGRSLRHPSIPRVHEASTDGESFYVVMDYVEGETLQDHVERKGPLAFDHAARIARQLGAALDHAHEKGVIHRDLKPRNVIIDRAGNAHLTDFGLAKDAASAVLLHDTRHGHGLGTPHYMAPEQFKDARGATGAADVYGLAAVIFFMLTGQPPFGEEKLIAALYKRVTTGVAPRASTLRAGVPHDADAALAFGLSRAIEMRPASAGELVAALAGALERSEGRPAAATTAPTSGAAIGSFDTQRIASF